MTRGRALATLLSAALFWAMVAALMHVGFVAIKYYVLGTFSGAERDFVWMVPLGYLLTFALLSVPAVVLVALLPTTAMLRVAVGIAGFFGILAMLLLFPQIHAAASVILAAGIGVRASALMIRRSSVALGTGLVVAVLATIALAAGLGRGVNEQRLLAALKPARVGSPNVILIILDTVRAANMSLLGYSRETTPELAKLAERGVLFVQAYSTAPWTLASHAAFFTGRYGSQLNTNWEVPLDGSETTVAEIFQRNGYATAGFVANRFYAAWDSGLGRGFIHYDDTRVTPKQIMLSTTFPQTNVVRSIAYDHSRPNVIASLKKMDLRRDRFPWNDLKRAEAVSAEFLEWLPAIDDRPFFAFLNFFDAHRPYTSPEPRRFSPNPTQADRYDAAIFHIDSVVGSLFDSLEARGVLANTIVVVTSDHGEGLGEHGLHEHGKSLYRTELHVPLLVVAPKTVTGGLRVQKPVSLRDLPATLLDLAGIRGSGLPGLSLRRSLTDGNAPGSAVISEITKRIRMAPTDPASRGDMRSALDDSTHFIVNTDGQEELYAWRADPGELRNIVNAEQYKAVVAAIRDRINRSLGAR